MRKAFLDICQGGESQKLQHFHSEAETWFIFWLSGMRCSPTKKSFHVRMKNVVRSTNWVFFKNVNFQWLIINFFCLGFLQPLVTKCVPKSCMNQPNLFIFCQKIFSVTASEGTYRNAKSIKHVTVPGPYQIDQNYTVSRQVPQVQSPITSIICKHSPA